MSGEINVEPIEFGPNIGFSPTPWWGLSCGSLEGRIKSMLILVLWLTTQEQLNRLMQKFCNFSQKKKTKYLLFLFYMSILPIYLINIHYFTIFNYFLHPSHFSLLLKSSHTQPMPPSTINPPSSSTATANRAPSSATNQNPDHQAPSSNSPLTCWSNKE